MTYKEIKPYLTHASWCATWDHATEEFCTCDIRRVVKYLQSL